LLITTGPRRLLTFSDRTAVLGPESRHDHEGEQAQARYRVEDENVGLGPCAQSLSDRPIILSFDLAHEWTV
jgi:hypothetical protein